MAGNRHRRGDRDWTGYCAATRLRRSVVLVADRRTELGTETREVLRERGGNAEFFACDVVEEDEVQAMIAAAAAMRGRIDVLVNNAGMPGVIAPIGSSSTTMSGIE